MKVELRDHRGVVGVVELRDAVAVPDERARKILTTLVVVVPGDPKRRLQFDDGETYLEALQHNLRGTYLWASAPID